MKNLVYNFWNGKITLWKSYWLVGELVNSLVILLIFNIEINIFNNSDIFNNIPFFNFNNFNIFSKIILIMWSFFITVGIWRSAEKYKGSVILTIITLIFLSYRIFTLRLVF